MRQINGNTPNNEFGLLFLSEGDNAEIYYLSDQEKTKGESKVLKRLKTNYPIYNFYRANLVTKSLTISKIEPVPPQSIPTFKKGQEVIILQQTDFTFLEVHNGTIKKYSAVE